MKAIAESNIEQLKQMSEHEFNIQDFENEADSDNSALHYAVKATNIEVLEYLLMINVDINKINKFGETALHLVSGKNLNEAVAEFLLLKGANPFVKN